MSKNLREIKRATKKKFTAEQKIRIVLEGLRSEITVSDLCRREGIATPTYYKWSKDFLDGGKNALTLETKRNATSDEVKSLRQENSDLRRAAADQMLDNIRLKKSLGILV
ncbi:MAG: transposase [Halobacteriovoraceae bacterium]|nr:transposase [Halobacteriovoraceae bacterium]